MEETKKNRELERPSAELIRRLKAFSVPELCDGAGLYHSMDYRIKPRTLRTRIVGPAVTVDLPSGEGALVADAILKLEPGDVLVIAGKGNCDCSYWGDHRSTCARMMGAAGVVIDGAFRDLEGCEEADFPIFAKALTCGTAAKSGAGAINVPVSCGGVTVHPGDLVAADVNGVCVFPPEEAEAIMERAAAKRRRQEEVLEEMRRTGRVITTLKKN